MHFATDVGICFQHIMDDPVIADDEHTYDRSEVEKWYRQCRNAQQPLTSPLHHGPVRSPRLKSNRAIKQAIEQWKIEHPNYEH